MNGKKTSSNLQIPHIGFGTYQLAGDACFQAVSTALQVGYRYIDTADVYHNHAAVSRAVQSSGLQRSDVFITSKVWHPDLDKQSATEAAHRLLTELKMDHVDLLLMHWPNRKTPIAETVEVLQQLKEEGVTRHIGVSNCTINHLKDLMQAGFKIENNQVEFHPSLFQKELLDFCQDNNIVVTAYSPLAQGYDLTLPLVMSLAEEYGRSPAQIVLNWIMRKDVVPIPRSVDPKHIKDNFGALGWELEKKDIAALDKLDQGHRVINPAFGDFDY